MLSDGWMLRLMPLVQSVILCRHYMSVILKRLRMNRRQMRKRTMLMLKGLKHLPKVEQYLRKKLKQGKELLKLKHQERMRNLRRRKYSCSRNRLSGIKLYR